MRRLRLFALLTISAAIGLAPAPSSLAQSGAPVQIGEATFSSVEEWEGGTRSGLLVTNNDGGELRLTTGSNQGVFESGLIPTTFRTNAIGAIWKAAVPQGTQLMVEVRGGPSGDQLGPWQTFGAPGAGLKADATVLTPFMVLPLTPDTTFAQLRITLSSTITNASPEIGEVKLSYYNSQPGPAQIAGLPRVAAAGPPTLTAPPQIIERGIWSGGAPGPLNPARQRPTRIVLHQIGDDTIDAPLPFLRALLNYFTRTLGQDDLPFHYLIDRDGTIFEGRVGGPTSYTPIFSADEPSVQVALIGSSAPTGAALVSLRELVAWIGQAQTIAPLGTHRFTPSEGAAPVERPNLVSYRDVNPNATSPSNALVQQIPALRQSIDQATVRSRWYFAEGNPQDYDERLSVLNPTSAIATVRFILLRQPGPAVIRETTVPPGGRADLIVNELFNDTPDAPAIIESNAEVIAERYMDFGGDISMSTGVRTTSRVWYFAEGSTSGTNQTYLVLFNPQANEAQATITYIRDDGIAAEQTVRLPALQRRVVVVADKLNDARFGTRIVATRPIVAERTMIFGQGSTTTSGGVHTAPGVTELSRRWYFAEGTTEAPFQMSILVLNPNAQPVDAAITFLTPDGTSLTRRYAIPATTRLALSVNEFVPQLGVATTVVADRPVAVERATTWNNELAGTASAGAPAPAYSWRFADGRTIEAFQEYLLVSNPGKNQARVTVEYVLANGTRVTGTPFTMPAGSRQTVSVHTLQPGQQAIAATVRASQPIVVERSLYRGDPRTASSLGGETVLGIPGD